MHVFRWDLDKTYLDTDIESFRGLIKAGLQRAEQKKNIPGSRALLRALTTEDPEARVFVLSGSPTQMRSVLAAKLALDGIEVSELILKNNLRNLRKGRFRAVRDQLGYKLPQLLAARAREGMPATETLFGDDSEVDALVYAMYAAVVAGQLGPDELRAILTYGRAYSDNIDLAVSAASRIEPMDAVEDIFIHVERGVPLQRFALLGPGIWPVFSWLQAAFRLHVRGRLTAAAAASVVDASARAAGYRSRRIANLAQDAVRRRLIDPEPLLELFDAPVLEPHRIPVERAVRRLGDLRNPIPEGPARYRAFLDA